MKQEKEKEKPHAKKHLITAPAVGEGRPLFLDAHDLPHVLVGGVGGHQVVIGQLVLLHDACKENKATHAGLRINRPHPQRASVCFGDVESFCYPTKPKNNDNNSKDFIEH